MENSSGGYLGISAEVFHALNVSCLSDICDPNLPASSNVLIVYFMGCQCVAAVSAVYAMGKVRGFSICSIRQLVGPGDFMSPRLSSAAREPVHSSPELSANQSPLFSGRLL